MFLNYFKAIVLLCNLFNFNSIPKLLPCELLYDTSAEKAEKAKLFKSDRKDELFFSI